MKEQVFPKLGAHLSIAGGYEKALERASSIGASCLQIFSGNPRSFSGPAILSDSATADFKNCARKLDIAPIYFHAPYLVNLASEEPTGDLSVKLLVAELSAASRLGVQGSIVHLGSFKKASGEEKERQYKLLIKRIKTILASAKGHSFFVIENAGTRKIGRTLEEIAEIMLDVGSQPERLSHGETRTGKRLKVCLDTCHLHAAGYDLRAPKKLDEFLSQFDRLIGIDRLECFHINDSRDPFGSFRDRHENIGEGEVGSEVFKLLLNHSRTKHLPFIIETPGFDGEGPDKKNLDILKGMAE